MYKPYLSDTLRDCQCSHAVVEIEETDNGTYIESPRSGSHEDRDLFVDLCERFIKAGYTVEVVSVTDVYKIKITT